MSLEFLKHMDAAILIGIGSLMLSLGLSAFSLARAVVRGRKKP